MTKEELQRKRKPKKNGQRRTYPAWSRVDFVLPKRKAPEPVDCVNCGKHQIPHAYFFKLKFCSFSCGRTYMIKYGYTYSEKFIEDFVDNLDKIEDSDEDE